MHGQRVVALAAVTILALGCSKDSTGVSADVSGSWMGTGSQSGYQWNFEMTLVEGSTSLVSGSGSVTVNASQLPFTVSGRRDGSTVTLSLLAGNLDSPIYTATLKTATKMSGALDGSGFSKMALELDRTN